MRLEVQKKLRTSSLGRNLQVLIKKECRWFNSTPVPSFVRLSISLSATTTTTKITTTATTVFLGVNPDRNSHENGRKTINISAMLYEWFHRVSERVCVCLCVRVLRCRTWSLLLTLCPPHSRYSTDQINDTHIPPSCSWLALYLMLVQFHYIAGFNCTS